MTIDLNFFQDYGYTIGEFLGENIFYLFFGIILLLFFWNFSRFIIKVSGGN
jgi:hypothetical protein